MQEKFAGQKMILVLLCQIYTIKEKTFGPDLNEQLEKYEGAHPY